jgi:hypothetical protein
VVLRVGSCHHDTEGTYGMSDSRWKTIKAELQKETETIFYRSGDVLLIDSVGKFDSELELTSSTGQLKMFPNEMPSDGKPKRNTGSSGSLQRPRRW